MQHVTAGWDFYKGVLKEYHVHERERKAVMCHVYLDLMFGQFLFSIFDPF